MGKWLIGGLLAAAAWTPMAQAQDGGWRGRHGDGQQRSAQPQQQPQQPNGGQGRGGWGGIRGAQTLVQPQAQAQVGVQAQADTGARRGGWNTGARTDVQAQGYGGMQARPDWQRPQQNRDASAQAARQQGFGARDRNGEARSESYARDRNDDSRPDSHARERNGDVRANAAGRLGFNGDRRGYDARGSGNRGYDVRGYSNGGNNGRWNSGWRRDDRYNWNGYRSYNRDAFRLPRYYAPYGWNYGYRRFSIGVVLTSGLWGQNYWIDDPYEYRLPEAYGPYRWVRYYNDALLVDVRSGVVVDTVYDIFWG